MLVTFSSLRCPATATVGSEGVVDIAYGQAVTLGRIGNRTLGSAGTRATMEKVIAFRRGA